MEDDNILQTKAVFFKKYFENQNFDKQLEEKLYSSFDIKKNTEITISPKHNYVSMIINFELNLPIDIFGVNFRHSLIQLLKNNYESRAYYIFYLDSIDYTPLLENEIPLAVSKGEFYSICLPLKVKLLYFKKNDIIDARLVLNIPDTQSQVESKISVYAVNDYISCKLNLTNNQIIEANYGKTEAILHDKNIGKKYKKNDHIGVKITQFLNNQLENMFTSKINCEGDISI